MTDVMRSPLSRLAKLSLVAVLAVSGSSVDVAGAGEAHPAPTSAAPEVELGPAGAMEDGRSVERLYRAYFLRAPDAGGLAYWQDLRARGVSLAAISDEFAVSPEFTLRYGRLGDADFVRLVYRNVLGRTPDAAGFEHWVGHLGRALTRGQMMIGFSDSEEFKRKTAALSPTASTNPAPAPATDADGKPTAPAGTYGFMSVKDGKPLQWQPCREIRVVANFGGAPAGAETVLRDSLSRLSAAMKIRWVYEGRTDERPQTATGAFDRPYVDQDRYGDRFAPVLVSWPVDWDRTDSAIGVGGFTSYRTGNDPFHVVTGQVILDSRWDRGAESLRALMLHELGHVANLAHPSADDQLMYGSMRSFTEFQYGDLAGLARVGGWDASCSMQALRLGALVDYGALDGMPAPATTAVDPSHGGR